METDAGLSLGDYLAAVKRRRLLVSAIAVPVIVAGIVLALAMPNVYRSTATFRLVTDRIAEAGEGAQFADQYVFSLFDKVFAGDQPTAIVRDLQPYPRLQDDPDEARGRLRDDTRIAMVTQQVLEPGGARERLVNTGFTLTYESRSPETSQEVAKSLVQAFLEAGRSDQLSSAEGKRNFYSGEVERIAGEIAGLEKRLADFRSANYERLPETAQVNFATRGRLEQELEGVEREIRTQQQNRVFIAQQLRQAQAGPAAGNLRQLEEEYARKVAVYAETHPDVVALRRQIDTLKRGGAVTTGNSLQAQLEQQRAVLAEARQRYSDDHPDIRRITRTIEALEARLAAGEGGSAGATDTLMSVQLQTQLNAIDTQVAGLQARAGTIRARLMAIDQELSATPEVEREFQQISRGLDSAREQYNQMIARRMDAEVEMAAINNGAADKFTLFAAPGKPLSPAGPPRIGLIVVSLILASILALSAVVATEALDSKVRGARDVRSVFGNSPLAVVPEIRNSITRQRRTRRVRALVGSVLIGAPVLYFVVRVATA